VEASSTLRLLLAAGRHPACEISHRFGRRPAHDLAAVAVEDEDLGWRSPASSATPPSTLDRAGLADALMASQNQRKMRRKRVFTESLDFEFRISNFGFATYPTGYRVQGAGYRAQGVGPRLYPEP